MLQASLSMHSGTRRLLLVLLFLLVLSIDNQATMAQQCGANTTLISGQCVCTAGTPPPVDEDGTNIYLAGVYDLISYTWAPDVFAVTVKLVNEGFFDDLTLPAGHHLTYDLVNAACDESTAVREYWNVRTANNNKPPLGIIGARCSGASIQLARVSGLEGVPQLSPASTTAQLSDDSEFPYFSRLVAPNDEGGEVGAVVALLREYGWD
ncbi:MAG: hypothetical protein ACX936_21575, partial [Marinobacter sp.]